MATLKIIFAGTPEFSVPTLQALLQSSHQVCAVYTQPDRPAGRGRKLTASPVKQLAQQHDIPVYQPKSLRDAAEQEKLQALQADVMIVVAYGLLLPEAVLNAPRLGCMNVHASLLPRWRGAAPIQRAILAGDTETGVTIMQMDKGLDTGAMLKKVSCGIKLTDTSQNLHDSLAQLGANALLATLENLLTGNLAPQQQNELDATYAKKLAKSAAKVDWQQDAAAIARAVRAFNPWPIAYAQLGDKIIRLWRAEALLEEVSVPPGTIIRAERTGLDVATGKGVLRILELQLPNAKVLPIDAVLNAKKALFAIGVRF